MRMNAMHNCKNPYQGDFKKALCLCSAGLLRSPTLAYVLTNNGYNTRAAGVHDYALIEVDDVLVAWADTIFCVEPSIAETFEVMFPTNSKEIIVLNIPDNFEYRDPQLIQIIEKQLNEQNIPNIGHTFRP